MPVDAFDAPATGAKFTDFHGRLLLITPVEVRENLTTAFGPTDAIGVRFVPLDEGEDQGNELQSLVFPQVLQSQLRDKVGTGRMVLGRLDQGTAKPGQSPPWILTDPSDADKVLARKWVDENQAPF